LIFLLPPSESKEPGGIAKKPSLSFPKLSDARALVLENLVEVSKSPAKGALALKLGPKQQGELQVNRDLLTPKVMAAIDRYTGVLYDSLKLDGLSKAQLSKAGKSVFIQSSLFGLISAIDQIPNYRLSASAKLPGVNLKTIWSQAHEPIWESFKSDTVIDLRSKAYAALAPIPKSIDSYVVEVLSEDKSGQRKALNHFNKQAKGSFIRAVLSSKEEPSKVVDLKKIAKTAGLKVETQGKTILLITHS
jgi:uncharacterized protein